MKIAIAGGIASGKSTVASIISEKYSIPKISFSDVLKVYCIKNGIEVNRTNLQNLGQSLIAKNGYSGFLDFIINESKDIIDWRKDVILEGFRHREVYKEFHKRFPDSKLIYCCCSRDEQVKRGIERENLTEEKIKSYLEHPVESDIEKLRIFKDFLYSEKTKKEELFLFIDSIVKGKVFEK